MSRFHPRVEGKPCWWFPPILILDFLCQRTSPREPHTYLLHVSSYAFSIDLFFNEFFYEWWGTRLFWLLYTPLFSLFFLDNLYRYLRNKYLKKHNLPGPYGYGSIDNFAHREDEE